MVSFLLIIALFARFSGREDKFFVDANGIAYYPSDRGTSHFKEKALLGDENYAISLINFDSNGTTVYSKLWLPKGGGKFAALIFLPGAGGTKDAGKDYAQMLAGKGIAILALDQRGFGESKEKYPENLEGEYAHFLRGEEYFQILMVYDALRAYDLLSQRPDVDEGRIAVLGESMGGRNALIAAEMEPRIRMAIGISTGGYGLPSTSNSNTTRFLRSFDPDNYIALISPRKVVIFHSENDGTQPFEIGLRTFNYAKDPKTFYRVSCKSHGLCDEMGENIVKELVDGLK